jgi:hypothetical protein
MRKPAGYSSHIRPSLSPGSPPVSVRKGLDLRSFSAAIEILRYPPGQAVRTCGGYMGLGSNLGRHKCLMKG